MEKVKGAFIVVGNTTISHHNEMHLSIALLLYNKKYKKVRINLNILFESKKKDYFENFSCNTLSNII